MSEPQMERDRLWAALKKLKTHEHACLLYQNRDEQLATTVPLIKIGLDRHEKCIYVGDDDVVVAISAGLRKIGVDVESSVNSGALLMADKRGTFLQESGFSPEMTIDFLRNATDEAKTSGFPAIRVITEMTWALTLEPGVEKLLEFESRLTAFYKNHDALAICEYDRNRFGPEVLIGAIRTHPIAIVDKIVSENPFYVPDEEALHPRPDTELAGMLNNICELEHYRSQIEQSNMRTKAMFESISDPCYALDSQWRFIFVNRAAAQTLQRDAKTLIGKSIWKEFPEMVGSALHDSYRKALSENKPVTLEIFFDSNNRRYEAHIYPYRDRLSVFFNDITRRAEAETTVRNQEEAIRKLSIPVLQVGPRLIAIPIIGQIDAFRARQLTEQMLRAIMTTRSKVVVLDITGVPVVDSAVANHLIQAVQAGHLLGSAVIITGVSPENAQTMVRIGVDLASITTTSDLQSGIEEANNILGGEDGISQSEAA